VQTIILGMPIYANGNYNDNGVTVARSNSLRQGNKMELMSVNIHKLTTLGGAQQLTIATPDQRNLTVSPVNGNRPHVLPLGSQVRPHWWIG
jgi:hypothetical protein